MTPMLPAAVRPARDPHGSRAEFERRMRFRKLATIFRHSAVFYPAVAAVIVVPNLVLGFYGYFAITGQQRASEEQARQAYLTIVTSVNRSLLTRVRERERDLPTAFPVGFDSRAAVTHLTDKARLDPLFKECYLVEAPSSGPSANVLPPSDLPRDGSVTAAASEELARWILFTERIWPRIQSQQHPRAHHVSLRLPALEGNATTPATEAQQVTLFVQPVRVGSEVALLLAWLDLDAVRREIVEPRLTSLRLAADMEISLREVNPDAALPGGSEWLVQERCDQGLAPHWAIGIRVLDLEEFRQDSRLSAAIYVMLVAIFVPFIGFGTWVLVRSLIKEIREARQKTDFVSRVTHELKTPLTSIRLFIETLQMGGPDVTPEELERCLGIIQSESDRLQRLIERVLDFGKMEAGNKVFHFRDDNIEQVVRDTIDFFRKQAQKVGGVIRLYIERNLPVFSFDRDGVREVLLNLLENAIKYSVGDKLVAIRVTRTKWRERDSVQIQVIDNGVGIRREDVPQIFDKFYRVDDRLTKGIDGSGLGLTLSREIARAHQGEILVESQHGRGSKFTLVLPLKPVGPR